MAERAQGLIQKFEGVANGFTAYIDGLSDAQWKMVVPGDNWTVGVAAHHVAVSLVPTAQATAIIASGKPLDFTMDQINQGNAQHAREHASATKAGTLALLHADIRASVDIIRGLTDAQLDTAAPVALMGGQNVPAQQFAENVWIGHVVIHWDRIKAAFGG